MAPTFRRSFQPTMRLFLLFTCLGLGMSTSPLQAQDSISVLKQAFHELRDFDHLDKEIYLENRARQPQLRKGAQGIHASINRPSVEAVRNARVAMVYEFATLHLRSVTHRNKRQTFMSLISNAANGVSRALGFSNPAEKSADLEDGFQNPDSFDFDDIPDPPDTIPEVDDPIQTVLGIHGGAVLNFPICAQETREMSCDPKAEYRSLSGRCNNLARPNQGKHLVPLRRYFGPEYDDGVARPKIRSANGQPLPNVRTISALVHHNGSNLDSRHTLMLMQWGQILDHDITSTPMIRGLNGSILDCSGCQSNGRHPGCYPILVPRSDKFFPVREARSGQRKCIPFTRSLPGQTKLGPREQINQNTAYVDASHLYGSHPCRLEDLRLHRNGRMRVLEHPRSKIFKNLMPRNNENDECRSPIGLCFHTGDDRNNEQPGLTSIHTLLLREHNRLADQLQAVNPLWNDEKTFQEARKILMAINQHISYNEFLPRVLGTEITRAFGLTAAEGYYHKYNPDCTADVHNEFATAAFRFGHSLIRPMFAMFSATMKKMNDSGVRLRDHFNNPDVVYGSHFIDQILRGMVMNPMEQFDNTISDELTNHLFQERGKQFSGMDLASLNIQRGRDHGLPGYTKYRRLCLQKFESRKFNQHPQGLFQQIRELKDLHHIFRPDVAQIVARLYRHVDDIDLFTGGLSEIPLEGAVVGPTFACLIADQFEKLRQCDRFWFESPDEHIQFSLEQLQEIRKVTLGSLICRNCDLFAPMPRNVFDIPDDVNNPMEDCQNHPMIDIAKWNDPKASSSSRGGRGFNVVVPFCDFEGRVALPGSKVRTSACVKCECNSDEICSTLKFDNCADLIEDVGPFAVTVDPNCSQECRSQAQAKILQSSTL